MSRQKDSLIAALLADPTDDLALLALADWHEEEANLPHQAALLRLAHVLRAVPYPEKPEFACHEYFVLERHYHPSIRPSAESHALAQEQIALSGCSLLPGSLWPHCKGWHGAGRLPGMAAAYHLLALQFGAKRGLPSWRRHVMRCELYSCGVITAAQRDVEYPTSRRLAEAMSSNMMEFIHGRHQVYADRLWALRGGRAASALHVMFAHESVVTMPFLTELLAIPTSGPTRWTEQTEQRRDDCWKRRSTALALARTYHRDLLRAFHQGEPAFHGRGVYQSLKTQRQRSKS